MKTTLAVIFGGKSTEHDISILSAMQVVENLDKSKYEILPIYITKTGEWLYGEKLKDINTFKNFSKKGLKKVFILPCSDYLFESKLFGIRKFKKIDCVMPILHGMNGEDGSVQGLLELANIPYTCCGIMASSIGMSKLAQKQFFEAISIPVVPYFKVTKQEFDKLKQKTHIDKNNFPVVVKPNRLGSSIGITLCKNNKQLSKALQLGFKFDDICLVEKAIKQIKEINLSVLGYKDDIDFSVTEEPIKSHGILSFTDKYCSNKKGCKLKLSPQKIGKTEKKLESNKKGMQNLDRIVPAKIDNVTKKFLYDYAKIIFEEMECKGVIRIDFIYDKKTKKLYVNEVNTIPGSLAYYLWEYKGISFSEQLDKLVEIAYKDYKEKNSKTFVFVGNVLKWIFWKIIVVMWKILEHLFENCWQEKNIMLLLNYGNEYRNWNCF